MLAEQNVELGVELVRQRGASGAAPSPPAAATAPPPRPPRPPALGTCSTTRPAASRSSAVIIGSVAGTPRCVAWS